MYKGVTESLPRRQTNYKIRQELKQKENKELRILRLGHHNGANYVGTLPASDEGL